jgi:beta-glucanase (GH16 family)
MISSLSKRCCAFGVMFSLASLGAQEWELVWADEFDTAGAPDPAKWAYDLGAGGWGNSEVQTYTDELENARVENGHLLIQVQQSEGTRVPSYTSARLVTRERQSLQYGRVEVRAKLPSETGTWSAIWMLSTDALLADAYWPDNGEIDIVEHVGYEEDPAFLALRGQDSMPNLHSTLHTAERNHFDSSGIGGSSYVPTASTEFHTYAFNWTPERMEFWVDDTLHFEVDKATDAGIPRRNPPSDLTPYWPFDQRFHLILNIAVGGSWGGHFNSNYYPGTSPYGQDGIDHDGVWPQTMEVDYVRFYKPAKALVENRLVAPGKYPAESFTEESGFILQHTATDGVLALGEVDPGDTARYTVHAAEAGDYTVRLDFAQGARNGMVSLQNESNGESLTEVALVDNGAAPSGWRQAELGVLALRRGLNELRLTALAEGADLGGLTLTLASAGEWNGLPISTLDTVEATNGLGPVSIRHAPWFYVSRADGWIYASAPAAEAVTREGQWIYGYAPLGLAPWGYDFSTETTSTAPWAYSLTLGRWYYASAVAGDATFSDPQWIYLY